MTEINAAKTPLHSYNQVAIPRLEDLDIRPYSTVIYTCRPTSSAYIYILVFYFQAAKRLREVRFQTGLGNTMKLTHLHQGSRSRLCGALPLCCLHVSTTWCSQQVQFCANGESRYDSQVWRKRRQCAILLFR